LVAWGLAVGLTLSPLLGWTASLDLVTMATGEGAVIMPSGAD
jgi:hypothetical protein